MGVRETLLRYFWTGGIDATGRFIYFIELAMLDSIATRIMSLSPALPFGGFVQWGGIRSAISPNAIRVNIILRILWF